MKHEYEDAYAVVEQRHPWFVARRELFERLAGAHGVGRDARIVDIGCGTGMFLAHLEQRGFSSLAGVEVSDGLRAKFRPTSARVGAAIPAGPFDAVFMLDVLEHIADDEGTLSTVHGILEPGGRFFVSVPAHPFLWGPHDELNEHQRRYTRRELRDKLRAAGFELERFSYWNMFVFPVVALVRWLGRGAHDTSGDVGLGPSWALRIYGALLSIENALLRWTGLPMGVSLVAVARRPVAPGTRAVAPGSSS